MRKNPSLDYANLPLVMAEAMMIHGNNIDYHVWQNIYESIGGVGRVYGNNDFFDKALEILNNLMEESYLPPIPPNTLRITHTTGLRLKNHGEEIVDLVKDILKRGLAPQAEGSGKYSELPTAVFALVDYPPNTKAKRLYNENYPWVTADIPFDNLDQFYRKDMRSGSVVTLTHVPAEYIIAVNGLPKNQWRL